MRKLRIFLAAVSFTATTLLFLDTTGLLVPWCGWAARMQFLPAALSLRAFSWGALAVVAVTLGVTALMGRIYCSVVCPLGIFQDMVAWLRRLPGVRRVYGHGPARTKVRLVALVTALAAGFCGFHFAVLAPYGIYGRALTVVVSPLARMGNNALAPWCHQHGWWVVKTLEVAFPAVAMMVAAGGMIVLVALCALAGGRIWCNTVCPVGTILGGVAKFAWLSPRIDAANCVHCGSCVRVCKAGCIDLKGGNVDKSRCVDCFNCSAVCRKGAIKWK